VVRLAGSIWSATPLFPRGVITNCMAVVRPNTVSIYS
jgi:hypothetical protein